MTPHELAQQWPEYDTTHQISETELARIAEQSETVEDATRIWETDGDWQDSKQEDDQ